VYGLSDGHFRHSSGDVKEKEKMTEEQMKKIMKEMKRKMGFVDKMEVVPLEVIDLIVGEMQTQIDLMVKGA